MKYRTALAIPLALLLVPLLAAPIPLRLEAIDGPGDGFAANGESVGIRGSTAVRAIPSKPPTPSDTVIEFEYFCIGGMPSFAVTPGPPFSEDSSWQLPPLGHSETWSYYASRLAPPETRLPLGWKELRIDFPLPAERTLQLRNVRIRAERPGEFDAVKPSSSASASEESLKDYLKREFPGEITGVTVGKQRIRIEGHAGGRAGTGLFLADIPMDQLLGDPRNWQNPVAIQPDDSGAFTIEVPRFRKRDGLDYDRLMSRWQLIRKSEQQYLPISHARYAERVASRTPFPPQARPASKKGLGGWHHGILPEELKDLGITAVTVNLMVNSLIDLKSGPGTVPTTWQGRTYHIRESALAKYDRAFREAHRSGAMVSVVLLLSNPANSSAAVAQLMGHPDAVREGKFAMPNVTSSEGIALYGAALNFIAERWSRTDAEFGRVHHWIVQNEVDAGWVWTNAGDKPDVVFMDLYQRSMRLTDLIARQYDPNSKAFISLTHHWVEKGHEKFYGSKRILELLAEFTKAEGDFPWALAHHPYPQNLRNPRAWEDSSATFRFDTLKITPRNIEVLDAYMKLPDMLYQGEVRTVYLSENGFNSPDYSPKALEDQAAGMAMAWKKISRLSSIESWQYHNWIDNRNEGGLRLGLRKFGGDPDDPLGKKPIWHLYQALGTPREDIVCAPYLKTLGITSWEEVIHSEPIR